MKKAIHFLFICILSFTAQAQNDPGLTIGDTGTITFMYRGAPVTYTTVRAADGLIWLQQNLGSDYIAAYASDSAAYGHYFQWGRWDDGHQVPTTDTLAASTLNPNNPAGIPVDNDSFFVGAPVNHWWVGGNGNDTWSNGPPSPTNGTDPCASIGPGWHLPSQPEFANAITLEGISDTATAFNSNLKLTLSGSRDFEWGHVRFMDTSGSYWTSSASDTLASHIAFNINAFYVNHPIYRGYGASVRCVANCTGVYTPGAISGPDTVCIGAVNTWIVPAVTYASNYLWTVPSGWTIIGPANTNSITVQAGNSSGLITVRSANACDTSQPVTMQVAIAPPAQPVISQSGFVLSTGSFSSYQWLFNGALISGANADTLAVSGSGSYQVIVTDSYGCSDTSAAYNVTLGIKGITNPGDILIYPNPAVSELFIISAIPASVLIYSMDGRLVLAKENVRNVHISDLSPGTYNLRLMSEQGKLLKIEKLIVLPH